MSKEFVRPEGVLVDVDGTLTNSKRIVSPRTARIVSELGKKGIRIGVATGRSYASLFRYILPFFPSDSLHIVAGGGQIVNGEGNIIWEKKIPSKEVIKICQKTEEMGASYIFGQGPILYCSNKLLLNFSKHPWQIDSKFPNDLEDWSTPLISIVNISQKVHNFLFEQETISIKKIATQYQAPYFDITPKGINKGKSASIWQEKVGIPLSKILVVGDSLNDVELFRVAGLSAAMGQSPKDVREAAKITIEDTDVDGLAKYLERVFS